MTFVGMGLSDALGGTDIVLASSNGQPFAAPVLQASGFQVSQDPSSLAPAQPSTGLSSLVMGFNAAQGGLGAPATDPSGTSPAQGAKLQPLKL